MSQRRWPAWEEIRPAKRRDQRTRTKSGLQQTFDQPIIRLMIWGPGQREASGARGTENPYHRTRRSPP